MNISIARCKEIVLEALENITEEFTTKQIAEKTGLSVEVVAQFLREIDFVKRIGEGKSRCWKIVR